MNIPDFVLRIIGKRIESTLNLQEGKVDTKKWYLSKGVWAAIVGGLAGIYGGLAAQFGWPPIPQWLLTILASIGLYSIRTADTKIVG